MLPSTETEFLFWGWGGGKRSCRASDCAFRLSDQRRHGWSIRL